ncbi:MAG: protein-L-isoaspartate(D-aspartate) O-methyltransferase [Deltaproteobacteria bacterium]|nr:protein-L-isoaspartate(D-aspartate) O-methyltransferase [Deltaproteobacteria bacterium]
MSDDAGFAALRREMVDKQLAARGIGDARVLAALSTVPRHLFVESALVDAAYEDRPLPIGHGQTISQPFMVARATQLAEVGPGDRALEVGAGCGYQAAVLAQLCEQVFGVELLPDLAARAVATLRTLGITNATVDSFDGSAGWPAHAPFDVIIVSAGAPRIPSLLVDQLSEGGRLVIPVGQGDEQQIAVVRRQGDSYSMTTDTKCRYVDLLGRYGFGGTPPVA